MGSTQHILTMATLTGKARKIEGDWEMVTEKCPVPVKLTVASLPGGEWMVALMIPRGNMITCLLREEGLGFHQTRFHMLEKETPLGIIEMEHEMAQFLKKGLTMIVREEENLRLSSSGESFILYGQEVPGTREKTDLLIPGSGGEMERCLAPVFIGTLCLFIIFYCHHI